MGDGKEPEKNRQKGEVGGWGAGPSPERGRNDRLGGGSDIS